MPTPSGQIHHGRMLVPSSSGTRFRGTRATMVEGAMTGVSLARRAL